MMQYLTKTAVYSGKKFSGEEEFRDPADADSTKLRLKDVRSHMRGVAARLEDNKPMVQLALPLPAAQYPTQLSLAKFDLLHVRICNRRHYRRCRQLVARISCCASHHSKNKRSCSSSRASRCSLRNQYVDQYWSTDALYSCAATLSDEAVKERRSLI